MNIACCKLTQTLINIKLPHLPTYFNKMFYLNYDIYVIKVPFLQFSLNSISILFLGSEEVHFEVELLCRTVLWTGKMLQALCHSQRSQGQSVDDRLEAHPVGPSSS